MSDHPKPLPTTDWLLLKSPLYTVYSLSEISPELQDFERPFVHAIQVAVMRERKAVLAASAVSSPSDTASSPATLPVGQLGVSEESRLKRIQGFREPLEVFCVECCKERIFKPVTDPDPFKYDGLDDNYFTKHYQCTWEVRHTLHWQFRAERERPQTITKVGQFPSAADIAFGELARYESVLSDGSSRRELGTAVGLNAHGVGIGAFVYLRRIFERLVNAAHEKAKASSEWDEAAYEKEYGVERMAERIRRLAAFLPVAVVDNAGLHGILSKGIHQLSENECKAHFPLLLDGIETILDEQLTEKRRQERAEKTKREVAKLADVLRKSTSPEPLDE